MTSCGKCGMFAQCEACKAKDAARKPKEKEKVVKSKPPKEKPLTEAQLQKKAERVAAALKEADERERSRWPIRRLKPGEVLRDAPMRNIPSGSAVTITDPKYGIFKNDDRGSGNDPFEG